MKSIPESYWQRLKLERQLKRDCVQLKLRFILDVDTAPRQAQAVKRQVYKLTGVTPLNGPTEK